MIMNKLPNNPALENSDPLLDLHRRVWRARQADLTERKELLHDTAEEVLQGLLDNEGLTEEELSILLQRKDLSAQLLYRLSNDKRVLTSYLCRKMMVMNPKTPASVALKFIGQLFIFDVLTVLLQPAVPPEIRTAGEELLLRKVPQLSLGERLTLARRTNADRVLVLLLDDLSREVVSAVLNNAFLRESSVCNVLRKATVKAHTVELVTTSAKWSTRRDVRYALLRTKHLSLGMAVNFLSTLPAQDLRDLAGDPNVLMSIRTYIKNTLLQGSQPKRRPF
jgi:hypothetical protein